MFWFIYQSSWESFLEMVRLPPHSLWFIALISFGVAMISTILNKLLTDQGQMNRQQEVIKEHSAWKKELKILAEENPKKYAKEYVKFQRRDKTIQKMQQNMSLRRFKPMCVTFVPFIIFFYLLRGFYSITVDGAQLYTPVAKPPMNANDVYWIGAQMQALYYSSIRDIQYTEGWINFSAYYVLCSFGLNIFIQKIFGVTTQSPGQMGNMFDQQTELPKPTS